MVRLNLTQLVRLIHTQSKMSKSVVEQVFQKAGGRRALMRSLGLSKQTMSDWLRDDSIPIKHCPKVHQLTGIPLEKLNEAFRPEKAK